MRDLIGFLNRDIEGEHRAIVQYLYHAWQAPDEAMRGKLEGLARDEMRHLEWLSEQVVELGGKPDLRRGPVAREGAFSDLLAADLADERAAVVAYRERIRQAEQAGLGGLALLLERILADEEGHRDFLEGALAHAHASRTPQVAEPAAATGRESAEGQSEGTAGTGVPAAKASPGEPGADAGPDVQQGAGVEADRETLRWGIRHEYEVILDYVYHALAGGDAGARHELLDLAVDEMKHLGWLAEHLTEVGGRPDLEGVAPPMPLTLADMLERGLAVERTVTEKYDEQARRTADGELKDLLRRIRLDELYHDHVFREMLERLGRARPGRRFTVGSLKKGV